MKRFAASFLLLLAACQPVPEQAERSTTLIVARAFPPESLDPAMVETGNEAPVVAQMYETLTGIDPASPDARVIGILAESWTVSPDGLQIDMRLRKDRVFSDGTPVDAAAVVWSFNRIKSIGRASAYYIEWFDRIEASSPADVRFQLKRPYAPALAMLSQTALGIINPKSVAASGGNDLGKAWLSRNSAGSGPYKSFRFLPGESVTLTANRFASAPPVHFAQLEFRALPDEGVRRLLLERGDVDLTDIVPAALVARYQSLEGVDVATTPGGMSLSFLTLNARNGPMADALLRQAVAKAIDYRALRDKILKGNAIQLGGYLTPGTPGFDKSAAPVRDLAGAQDLLKRAGYKDKPVTLMVSQFGPVAEFIQSNLADAGFNIQIERRQPGAIAAMAGAGRFDIIYDGWTLDTPDATPMLEALLTTTGRTNGTNRAGYANVLIDRNVSVALATNDQALRRSLLAAVDRQLRIDRPLVYIFSANPNIAYRRDIKGVTIDRFRPGQLHLAQLARAKGKAP
jgi:peptide/nickel transport system substrate-binding protein